MPGLYIALEGIDGVGKTTQVAALVRWLNSSGVAAVGVCEPSDSPIGRRARFLCDGGTKAAPETIALAYAADTKRVQDDTGGVLDSLDRGVTVVSDRCFLSTYAYLGPQCGREWLDSVHEGRRVPDLVVLLDLEPEVAARRLRERGVPPISATVELQRLRGIYLEYCDSWRRLGRTVVVAPIDARASEDVVQAEIRDLVKARLIVPETVSGVGVGV